MSPNSLPGRFWATFKASLLIVTPMRSSRSLSSLVRSVLLAESRGVRASPIADETVVVHPPQVRPEEEESESNRELMSDMRKSAAYVGTQRWRDAVMKTYAYLDGHVSVDDVVVLPIACDMKRASSVFAPNDRYRGRARLVSREEAARILGEMDVELPSTSDRSIIFVPFVGGGISILPRPESLPSAWMTVHSMFDEFQDKNVGLRMCSEVMNKLERFLEPLNNTEGRKTKRCPLAIPLLFNCGWAENAFSMTVAAYSHPKRDEVARDEEESVLDRAPLRGQRSILNLTRSPAVGRRYRDPADVPFAAEGEKSFGNFYVNRLMSDYIAEAMTIAVTKPEGFEPVVSRIPHLPIEILRHYAMNRLYSGLFDESRFPEFSPSMKRSDMETLLLHDLEEIGRITNDSQDRLVKDLAGSVVLVAVH